MANRHFQPIQALDREVKILCGTVVFGGSGAVSSVDALGFTVTKVGGETGIYRVTLDDKYGSLMWAGFTLYDGGTAADVAVNRHSAFTSSTIVDFQTTAAGSAADATSGHACDIVLFVRNSALPRKGV